MLHYICNYKVCAHAYQINHIDGVMVNVIASSAVDRGFDNINKYEIRRQSCDSHGIHVVAKHKSIHIWLFTPTDANTTNKVSSNRPKSDRSLSWHWPNLKYIWKHLLCILVITIMDASETLVYVTVTIYNIFLTMYKFVRWSSWWLY
jgi:hypothetical protein